MDSFFSVDKSKPNIFQNENQNQFIDIKDLPKEKLLSMAESNYLELNYDKAGHFYEEAIKKYPADLAILTSFGNYLFSTKDMIHAQRVLEQAVNINPAYSYKNFLMLGELNTGLKSIECYQKGIELMWTILSNPNTIKPKEAENNQIMEENEEAKKEESVGQNPNDFSELKRDLAEAYSAIAEIYQTDFLYEKSSELLCLENLKKSIEVDPECLHGHYQFANFFLNKENDEEAKKHLLYIVGKLESNENWEKEDFELKHSVVKLLIEVENFDSCIAILEKLLLEDEQNAEILYLAAFCNFKIKHYNTCLEYIEDLRKLDISDDPELLEAFKELEVELGNADFKFALDNDDNEEEKMNDGDNDDEGEWMDVE